MKYNTSKDKKITMSVGVVDYLVREVEQKRKQVERLSSENRVMNNFFKLVDGLMPRQQHGAEEDRFYYAKKEFEAAVYEIEKSLEEK